MEKKQAQKPAKPAQHSKTAKSPSKQAAPAKKPKQDETHKRGGNSW
ncbi:hypothetical protein NB640_00010 [Oxalobacter vibrioformis]|uniref:Uncharacterized protein n=1 Tax=Oxalobacter vibrioformis TaxID=933080 RepID=A0A9E9LVS0_9BURK|nr:hypothetical protein [Oxalobacter vibrioformis]WAW10101.1 hypothetical protein NB640_00010 [Oxalobacter vibrioformis]